VDCIVDCDGVLNLGNFEKSEHVMYHRRSHRIGPECRISTGRLPAEGEDVQRSRRRPLRPSARCVSRSTPFRLAGACRSKLSLTQKMSGSPRGRAGRTEVPCRTRLRQVEVVCDSKRSCCSNVAPVSFRTRFRDALSTDPLSPNLGLFSVPLSAALKPFAYTIIVLESAESACRADIVIQANETSIRAVLEVPQEMCEFWSSSGERTKPHWQRLSSWIRCHF
jgi:hypothetical protein